MARVLVVYYSSYGHTEKMAYAVAEGARAVPGVTADVKRVPELVPIEVAQKSYYKLDQDAPIADVNDLADYDAVIIGSPSRFGVMAAQIKQYLDQAGGLWYADKMVNKVGAAFTSSSQQHGGHESTIISLHFVLLNMGMMVVGLPCTFKAMARLDAVAGCSSFGAGTLADPKGEFKPQESDFDGARFQGRNVAEITKKLYG